jgi:hypothetical protein
LHDADLVLEPLTAATPRSLLVAAQRGVLEGWIEVFSQAGLVLDALEPLPICLWRAVQPCLQGGLEVLVQVEDQHTWVLAFDQGLPLGEWCWPPLAESPEFLDALQRWRGSYQPSVGYLSGLQVFEENALLSSLEDQLGCPVKGLDHHGVAAPLWGVRDGERRR